MASGGDAANIIGTSLLGYWAGKKAQDRQGEIAGTAAQKADPWGPMRGYYQGILGKMYGMPEGYGQPGGEGGPAVDTGEPTNELEKLFASIRGKTGEGQPEGNMGLGALLGGAGGGMLGGLLG